MCNFLRTLYLSLPSFVVFFDLVLLQGTTIDFHTNEPNFENPYTSLSLTEHAGGTIVNDKLVFSLSQSPYWLRNDIIVERDAELVIEAGVTIKVEPQVGITVRGILTAVGTENQRITLQSAGETSARNINFPDIRLVDGPSILAGRVQLKHNGQWRSVCTNSKNWTIFDMETACRQLGFQGGTFHQWFNRLMPLKPRLLYEEPKCIGTETSLLDCQWTTRQLGSGVCDYHPDLGIECLPRHDKPLPFWRGLRFEQATTVKKLISSNTLYVPESLSKLHWVNIQYAGVGRDLNTTSSIDVIGVAPGINHLEIYGSAYNGINITNPEAPISINNCTIRSNRGYGIFINSSYGLTHIDGCAITENGGDGIRFVRAEERPEEKADRYGYSDFCQLAIASTQTFPLQLYAQQSFSILKEVSCDKVFTTRYGHILTLQFVRANTDRNNSASLEIYDGSTLNHRLLTKFPIRNNTRPQAITSLGNQIYVKFRAEAMTDMVIFMRIVSGLSKAYDLNVSNSDISENIGRGVAIDNLRSQIHVHKTSVSKNEHVAGVHVTSGVGEVNITESRISFNEGDGINITYTGGSRNISKTSISSNNGYGAAIWLNDTAETEFIFVNQTTVVQYSEIYKNLDVGVLHGNYCGDALFNFTENQFKNCLSDALEVLTCWKPKVMPTKLQIGHNRFLNNERISLKIFPAVNLEANIEYNHFRQGSFGGLLIKNKPLEEFNALSSNIFVQQNYFINNTGTYAVNLALSPYAENQYLLFTRNFLKTNKITEPFQMDDGSSSNLNPRSRVAAPVVVGSDNIDVFRNIIENPDSKYEIGSHLEDQSKTINCTYNWLGYGTDEGIFHRVFHRYDRYNLARISFIPFLLHNTNPLTSRINVNQFYVPKFSSGTSDKVGGEIEGEETINKGEYIVTRDISIRPGGKLTIEAGVTLRFPPSIGMMIGGRLDARGIEPDSIRFTLKEELVHSPDNITYEIETEKYDAETEIVEIESKIPIRLLGGNTETEGRLQVKINDQWGTVCSYGWTIQNAALVCQQLGFVLNPDDWYLERNEIPAAGTTEPVIMSNVDCDDHDLDITKCKSETIGNFENSCTHENDVGLKCYKTSWAGVRFSSLAERTDIQFLTIEQSGLLDYATSTFKPALQLDFARQNFENIKVVNNNFHGLGIMYSDIYSESVNIIKNSEFSNNRGAGVSLKQLGLTLYNTKIENNFVGIEHNPTLTGLQQRELAGWFIKNEDENYYNPFLIPHYLDSNVIELQRGETKYFVTTKVVGDSISRVYKIQCEPGWSLGIQLLHPIENRSTENIIIRDSISNNPNSDSFVLNRDLTIFPVTSSSHGIVLEYVSGNNAFGGTVLVIITLKAPIQNVYNRIVKGPVPTLSVSRTVIRNNMFGVHASYFNRYLDELGNHFLRKANESMRFLNCEISHNLHEAIFIHSPNWDLHKSNLSEIQFMLNRTLITDNGKGIYQFSRDMRMSNNLFHFVFQDNTIERNKGGGFEIALPYVWQYNENFTHSVYMDNNTWVNNRNFEINIDGHFALINVTYNIFKENKCKKGLFVIRGMEKKLLITNNKFTDNNGQSIVQFSCDSQSEIIGNVPAVFRYNELRNNKYFSLGRGGILQLDRDPTSVITFRGVQKVNVNRNLLSDNSLEYQLIAGIKTAKINNFLDIKENWWGSDVDSEIKSKIFDFDDWNDHAIAIYRPFLLLDDFQASYSVSFSTNDVIDLDHLGGRIYEDLTLTNRGRPYTVLSDITIMPNITLTIYPGVIMEFAPNVGILVLGTLNAKGYAGSEIIMQPVGNLNNVRSSITNAYVDVREKREIETFYGQEAIRLCKTSSCVDISETKEGFLEYFNTTTLQWIPMCDTRFTERNAQVVCRELGFDPLKAFFDFGERIDFHSNSLTRIWTWPEPLQCAGTETKYQDCPIRLNGQQFGHRHKCEWNSKFVFIHCERYRKRLKYWGGIRFADAQFEQQLYNNRIHDIHTHTTIQSYESTLQYVKIYGAGILHNEKSSAIQSVIKSPLINFVNIDNTAFHAIDLISPAKTMNLLNNNIQNSLGVGINILSLSGEGMLSEDSRVSEESSFTPLRGLNIPYSLFSLVDICDTHKEINVQERVLLYYKYDNHPVNCIKIFRSMYNIKLGLRLLQFNLFNSSVQYGIPDFLQIYDGDIYNFTHAKVIDTVSMTSGNEKKLFKTTLPSLSVKLFANGASSDHGFIAEIVTSASGFNRDVQHNISNSVVNNNRESALLYMASGEVNPIVTIEKNQFKNNCMKLYGNFTTCKSAIEMDVQNTRTIIFRANLMEQNQGGLLIRADSSGSATSLRGWIYNNLFVNNTNLPALYVEGQKSSHYQEITIYRNYFTRNFAQYHNNIILRQVVSNFTYNYVKRNIGLQNLEISGFDKVRFRNVYQTTTHNGFYNNYAILRDSRSTIVAGTAGQHYVDNIFFNPDNDYEMITVNRSLSLGFVNPWDPRLQPWDTKIDAANNYWGINTTFAVRGRIKDQSDDYRLLEVKYEPFYMNNRSILNGKCPPGWDLVGETCYMYVGAPMTFWQAKAFCQADNASMPYLLGNINYVPLYDFLRSQDQWYQFSDKVWVQHIDRINECTIFAYQSVVIEDCNRLSPFICEIDPKVSIKILPLADDMVTISVISSLVLAVLLIIIVGVCWWSKSKYRQAQRLERRNSIRQSLHSLRSVGLSQTSFADPAYRKKVGQLSTRSTDTLTKKMITNGSIDSMEKSYSSSLDDNQSYDVYESRNPNPSSFSYNPTIEYHKSPTRYENQYAKPNTLDLAFKNEGFRDNSTFATNSNYQSRAESVQDDSTEESPIMNTESEEISYPPSEYFNTDTLPLRSDKSDSTLDLKRGIQESNQGYEPSYSRDRPNYNLVNQELKSRLQKPPTPPRKYSPTYSEQLENLNFPPDYSTAVLAHSHSYEDRPKSADMLETDFDEPVPKPKTRSKSEVLLETNFDYTPPGGSPSFGQPITDASRSKSQPLETAM